MPVIARNASRYDYHLIIVKIADQNINTTKFINTATFMKT